MAWQTVNVLLCKSHECLNVTSEASRGGAFNDKQVTGFNRRLLGRENQLINI